MHFRPMHGCAIVPSRSDGRRTFSLPHEVIDDPSLSLTEKRELLAEWASDQSAVQSYPTLRWLQGTTFPVTFSSVMDARQKLDRMTPVQAKDEGKRERGLVVASFAAAKSLRDKQLQ